MATRRRTARSRAAAIVVPALRARRGLARRLAVGEAIEQRVPPVKPAAAVPREPGSK